MYETEEAIDIYPGTALFAATLFRGRNIEGAPPGLGKGHFCRIDFDRRRLLYKHNFLTEIINLYQ